MEFKVVIDISERLENALNGLVRSIQSIQLAPAPISEPVKFECVVDECPETTPEQKDTLRKKYEQIESTTAEDVKPDPVAEVEQPKKTAKKKPSKKAETAPATTIETSESATQLEPENVATDPKAEEPEPVQTEPASVNIEDPMQGMSLVDALQKLTDEIDARGLELSAVNARVRKKANELGLSFGSALQLIKAIGYIEARKIALGE